MIEHRSCAEVSHDIIAPMSSTSLAPGLYEATDRIYAIDSRSNTDRWIIPPERFTVGGNKRSWGEYPKKQLYYDLFIGSQNLKVLDKELEGKEKKVQI